METAVIAMSYEMNYVLDKILERGKVKYAERGRLELVNGETVYVIRATDMKNLPYNLGSKEFQRIILSETAYMLTDHNGDMMLRSLLRGHNHQKHLTVLDKEILDEGRYHFNTGHIGPDDSDSFGRITRTDLDEKESG